MSKRIVLGVFLAVVASAITAGAVVVVVGQQGDGQEPPQESYIPPEKALKPGEVEIPAGTPVADLTLPMDYGRFRIIPYGNVPNYTPDWLPPPGIEHVGADVTESDSLDDFRDHDLFVDPPYIPAGWELTWAQARTALWDDGSHTDTVFALKYERPQYFYIRINRFLIAPEGQVELLAPPATAQDALILNEIRGHPAVFLYQGPLQVHFVIDNVVTYVEGVAIDFDELIKIADGLIAQTDEPTAAAPAVDSSPTPRPGVCPTPVRPTAEELGSPPPEIWGQRVQGGVAYSAGYVTVHLPAGREFSVLSYWSHDDSGILIDIYDVQSESALDIRGDGCERGRFLRQPVADAVFDEVMRSLEIGSTYVCPAPVRTTYEDLPVPVEPPPADGAGLPGRRVQGGAPFKFGQTALQLPAGREFLLGPGVSDPGGGFLRIYDIQTRSSLFLRPDGCETSRMIWDPAADSVFDEIVGAQQVPTRGALGCVDCEVKGGQALRVTAEDIQLGPDGKYYVPDRGDGCAYREVDWGPGEGSSWVTLHAPGCEVFWVYRPVIGEVQAWTP